MTFMSLRILFGTVRLFYRGEMVGKIWNFEISTDFCELWTENT